MLYSAATSREIIHGTAYLPISRPTGSVSKKALDFCSIFSSMKKRAALSYVFPAAARPGMLIGDILPQGPGCLV